MQQSTLQVILFTLGMPALIIFGGRAVSRIVVKLKEKYTYPRTGYVSYPRKTGSKRWSRALLAAILGMNYMFAQALAPDPAGAAQTPEGAAACPAGEGPAACPR